MLRYSRQAKLTEVKAIGQSRIGEIVATVPMGSLAGIIAASYLAGAGVKSLVVMDEKSSAAARGINGSVNVEMTSIRSSFEIATPFDDLDPSAAAVARGAWFALRVIRAAINEPREYA